MTVHIRPEFEAILLEDAKSCGYESAEEYIERAILLLHEERLGPVEIRGEKAARIEEGWAEAGNWSTVMSRTRNYRVIARNGLGGTLGREVDGQVSSDAVRSPGY